MKIIKTLKSFIFILVNLSFLFIYFSFKVINSGWIVGWLVIKGYRGEYEGIIEYKLQNKNPWHIILLFNLISMTPGSLSLDLSKDHTTIFVHLLNCRDKDNFLKTTKKIENMLLKSLNNEMIKDK